ncbi:hypothetical protein [Microbacterium sediminis]|uniref:Uncharacterized protein n=1 Tax=Microbacterium sediminis TaxID=904291 RepID=A0A1B9NG02_9MICO|nr:hypothetical protein [Microbacterium sediminis]OCG75510.1 hypothetical protein A7J15_00110 [Microbacterium sediminis]QBR73904.1 hypothetical protein E3O41_05365 [Microbacterium sediminis]
MTILVGETTTQVVVKAYTTLGIEGLTLEVKGRVARLHRATVYWAYEAGAWVISFVQLTGPILKADGTESRRMLHESTRPADDSRRQSGVATPPEIVEAALAHMPDWKPEINETRYPRDAERKTSL